MRWVYAAVIGTGGGAFLGWIAQQLPFPSVVQSVTAFLAALVVGDVYLSALVQRLVQLPVAYRRSIYHAFGRENLRFLAALAALTVAIHEGLALALPASYFYILSHRPVFIGAISGPFGTLMGVWAVTLLLRYSEGDSR